MGTYSFNRPRRDGRLSWPCWLTDSGRRTHKVFKQPSISLAKDKESPPARTDVLTTMLRHQQMLSDILRLVGACSCGVPVQLNILNVIPKYSNDDDNGAMSQTLYADICNNRLFAKSLSLFACPLCHDSSIDFGVTASSLVCLSSNLSVCHFITFYCAIRSLADPEKLDGMNRCQKG